MRTYSIIIDMFSMVAPLMKTKTRKGKRMLEDRKPKIVENDKQAIIVKGGKTNDTVTNALHELYLLKKPLVQQMKRKNPIHVFDDETPMEKFASKFDTSLFLFGSNSKKHPNSLVFGRLFDGTLLDMAELRIDNFIPSEKFGVPRPTLGSKPCVVLEGSSFETDPSMKRVGNIMVDFFRGPVVDTIRLQGLETVISLTAKENTIMFRVYKVVLKKSASATPRVELVEMGPSMDLTLQRKKLAEDALFKNACKLPKQITKAKRRKNTSVDVFGNILARVHVGRQNADDIQTRKMKGLKKTKPTANGDAAAAAAPAAEAMEE